MNPGEFGRSKHLAQVEMLEINHLFTNNFCFDTHVL